MSDRIPGLLVMDTCCFVSYIKNKSSGRDTENEVFDYEGVKNFIKESGYRVVITPYTLYECIQGCDTFERFKERRSEMATLWDFWVLNMNGILPKDYSFEAGPDFLFKIRTPEEFLETIRDLREKVYSTLQPRIVLLAQLIAVVYLLVSEQNENESYPKGFLDRVGFALSDYFRKAQNFKAQLYTYFVSYANSGLIVDNGDLKRTGKDSKERLSELVHDFAIQIINVSKVRYDESMQGVKFSWGERNNRIIQECMKSEGKYGMDEMRGNGRTFLKKYKNVLTLEKYVDAALQGCDTIFKHLFKKILTDWFCGGVGKQLINTIIDYVNEGVIEIIPKMPVIYMTEETKFVDLVRTLDDKRAKLTQDFYKKYYIEANS